MRKTHSITANGHAFSARTGELILDAALASGVSLPHDCRSGRCGSCVAQVVEGVTLGGHAPQRNAVYTCQARALSDLELQFEPTPPVRLVSARVASLTERAVDVVEVGLRLEQPLPYFPGQYCAFQFAGFPRRCFSPTSPADGGPTEADMTLHVKRVRNGRVSTAIGREIAVGRRLKIEGPFGTAFFRPASDKRLVLIAGGTGFAPVYDIAVAALRENPARRISLVVGVRKAESLYMAEALVALQRHPGVDVAVAIRDFEGEHSPAVRRGDPADLIPALTPQDVVYAAGAPAMVDLAGRLAMEIDADFHADPFEPSGAEGGEGWLTTALRGIVSPRMRASRAGGAQAAARAPAPSSIAPALARIARGPGPREQDAAAAPVFAKGA